MKRIYYVMSRWFGIFIVAMALVKPLANVYAQNNSPLCFTARNGGVSMSFYITNASHTIQYSINGTDWSTYSSNTNVTLKANQSICFRAETDQTGATAFGNSSYVGSSRFFFSSSNGGTIEGSGNIMSLYGPSCPDLPLQPYAFANLFYQCSLLTTPPALPATSLAQWCYSDMFSDCTSLAASPALPATSLAQWCYLRMFYGCTSLAAPPALPATSLAPACYGYMFIGCTSLMETPALPAITLAYGCYQYMFYGCTSLAAPPALPATTLADHCYERMFYNCFSLRVNTSGPGKPWEIPTFVTPTGALTDMFTGTGGTMNGTPSVNTTYYIVSARVSLNVNDSSLGSVSGAGVYNYGNVATLTATPVKNHHFAGWSDGDTTNPRFVTLVSDTSFTAIFEINSYNVSVNDPNGSVSGTGTYVYNTMATLTATPNEHCYFAGWPDGDTALTKSFIVTGDTTFKSLFAKDKHTVTATCEHGIIYGYGEYEYGDYVTLYVVPDEGYRFVMWSDSSLYNPRAFVIKGDFEIEAYCEEAPGLGMVNVEETMSFYCIDGVVVNPDGVMLRVYSAAGVMVRSGNGDIMLTGLPAGVYMVVDEKGRALKVGHLPAH